MNMNLFFYSFIFLCSFLVCSVPPLPIHYTQLHKVIENYLLNDPLNRIPKLVRLSFHDLANYDPMNGLGGPFGCIASQPILGFTQNKGLEITISDLQTLVFRELAGIDFSLGDVFSLAGKVAVELAYPCIQIKWRYGRSPCVNKSEMPGFPSGFTDAFLKNASLSTSLKFALDRYGLDAYEMGVLVAGGHGIKGASAHIVNSGWGNFPFSLVSSGKNWILQSLQANEWIERSIQFESSNGVMRLPSDMMFFPSTLDRISKNQISDPAMLPVELQLRELASKDRFVFDKEFERVFSKMLEIGVSREDLQEFIEPVRRTQCFLNTMTLSQVTPTTEQTSISITISTSSLSISISTSTSTPKTFKSSDEIILPSNIVVWIIVLINMFY